jgi:hypothetical protein
VNLIIHEQRSDGLAILPEHIGTHIDVFCLGLGLQEVFRKPVELQDIIQEHQARRARFHRDECDRYRGRVAPENRKQLLERVENFFRRCADGQVVVAGIDHDRGRFERKNNPVGVPNTVRQALPAKSTIQHGVSGKILL